MRILLLPLAALVLLAGSVVLTGYLLPATREGRAETVIAAAPEAVLQVIADVESQPDWRSGIVSVRLTDAGWEEVTQRGETITFLADEMTPQRVRLRFTSDAGYLGGWDAELRPVAGGTRIAVVERATVSSPLGRIVARLMFDPTDFATVYLAALKARVEG